MPDATPHEPALPEWLEPVRRGAETITVDELTRFVPPEGTEPREGAVLMLFGEGSRGPDLLLTERAHDMRSHPGQVSFPGGSTDPEDASPAATALREAEEETGLDPAGVDVFATLPRLWLPPSNFAVTPVLGWWREESAVGVVDPAEVHAVYRVPIEELLDPDAPGLHAAPLGLEGPGVPDRRRQGPDPVGLHRRDHRPALRLPRLDTPLGRRRPARPPRPYADRPGRGGRATTDAEHELPRAVRSTT